MGIKKKDNSDDLVINDMEDWKNLRNVPGLDLFVYYYIPGPSQV